MYRLDYTAYESGFPTGFGFNGALVQDPTTGLGASGLAQFMMGAVGQNTSSTGLMWNPYERWRYWGFFGQDDFRVSRTLTVNLGLRYDIFGLFSTRQGPASNFCLGCFNPLTGLPGKVVFQGDSDWPGGAGARDIFPPNWNDVSPRVNFAWAVRPKTVIRGGYDILYSDALNNINMPGEGAANEPGWLQNYTWDGSFYPNQCASFSSQCVVFPLSDTTTSKAALTTPPIPSTFPAASRSPMLGLSLMQFFEKPTHDPMVQMWNIGIERNLPRDILLSVGYVGNHGTHLAGDPFRTPAYVHTADALKYKTQLYSDVPITSVYSGLPATMLEQVYGTTELPLSHLLTDYPFEQSMQENIKFDGTTLYNALNVKVQKRYSHGLSFTAAYTVSKDMTNGLAGYTGAMLLDPIHGFGLGRTGEIGGRGGALGWGGGFASVYQNKDNRDADRAVAAIDIPQMLNIVASYELPLGRGKAFVNQRGVLNTLLGAWLLAASFNAQSGVPLAITCPSDQLTNRCDQIGNPAFGGNRTRQQQIADWINPAAFQPAFGGDQTFWANYNPADPRAWQFGTMGPRTASFRGPGFSSMDSSLTKEFRFTENKHLQFRWEVFNAFNHQSLGLPNTNWCLPPNADGSTDLVHQAGCSFGLITNIQTDPRNMEFALKFYW
jgi:hypothetical protein